MVSRRTALAAIGSLLGGVGAGCIGRSGPSSDRVEWRRAVRGSPLRVGDALYVVDRLTLYALSPADGSDRWTVAYEEDQFDERLCLRSQLAADERRVYLPACDGLRALRRADGEAEWLVDAPLRAGATAVDGRVYANGDDLLAVDADAGSIDWRVSTGGDRLTRPAATEGVVVLANRVDGVVTAFDPDGERRWSHRTDAETRSPTVADGTVYVATAPDPGREGRLLALAVEDGTVQWSVETPSLKRGTRPVVGSERLFLGCNGRDVGRLVALNRADGAERWSVAADNRSVYEPVVDDGTVYAGSNDDTLYAYSVTGEQRWTVEAESTVGSVAVDDAFVYASSNERLFAVER